MDLYRDFSDFYDLYVGGWLEDLPFYARLAEVCRGPLLEVGAGTGRLTLPLARQGADITAVDLSESMLARLRARLASEPAAVRNRVRPVHADMLTLHLGRTYEVIFLPFYTFNYLLTPEDQHRALTRLKAHLAPEGQIAIDVFVPHSRVKDCPPGPVLKTDTTDPASGCRVRGWVTYHFDLTNQIETRDHLFEVTGPDGAVRQHAFKTRRRYSFKSELQDLSAAAGLAMEQACEGYGENPANEASEQITFVLRHS